MLFSVIIPTFNREGIIQKTLESVLAQTFSDFEVIVVDDGSTDGTARAVKSLHHPRVHYHYKINEERAVARNYGASLASGQFLIFLDSDDLMQHDHLEAVNRFLKLKAYQPSLVFTGYTILDPGDKVIYQYGKSGLFRRSKLFYGNYLGCSAMVIRKEVFKKFQFSVDRRLILFEDWELWLRVSANTPIHCIPCKSIVMTNHEGRSVLNVTPMALTRNIIALRDTVFGNIEVISRSFLNRRIFLMGIYSYTSLHIALTGKDKAVAFKYLMKALFSNPLFIFKSRFFGILKQFI